MRKMVWMMMVVCFVAGGVFAEETVSKEAFNALQLEVAQLRAMLQENQAQTAAVQTKVDERAALPTLSIPEGLEFSGVIEVEAGYNSTGDEDASDISLATVELAAGWQFDEWVRADVVALYEDGEELDIDQGFITLGNPEVTPFFLQLGKMYVPFGNFDSLFISDPIVLELGEAQEDAALLGFEKGGFFASVSVFNGDVQTDGESQVENAVVAASYTIENEDSSVAFGAAWIRNIMDSDGLTGMLDDSGYVTTSDDTGGLNAWVSATMGPATLIAEYVKVLDSISIDGVDTGFQPESLNLELGFALSDRVDVAGKIEKSRGVADWFAETRCGVVCNVLLRETDLYSTGLSLEYMHEEFDGGPDADLITMQLGLEF